MRDALVMWTVYSNPSDYPGRWVVRRARVYAGAVVPEATPVAVTDTLEAARAAIPPGLFRQPRYPEDDPVIAEVWF